ncbi:hypothetical protein CWE25_02435 [Idiomarina fontislapidosi]|uniref:DUF4468 domain-containing protein n=2 Tax=Idiomarina fontislapidosi TaxID=263723 RepID=A0A432YBZ7_9GAMM|nr:hypothetical protein CWE25_02435 [Idiomarina fontislapidosi]
MDESNPTKFTYDYKDLNATKDEIFSRARNFLATNYGDTNEVLRVVDAKEGIIIGRGSSPWYIMTNSCSTEHNVKFAAKDNKARLQFELIQGAPAYSGCQGWAMPTEQGYQTIKSDFNAFSERLEQALKGEGKNSDFNNF